MPRQFRNYTRHNGVYFVELANGDQTFFIRYKKDRKLIGFVERIGSNLRSILTKEKEEYFIALFLDKHKYYETEMEKLGF